MDNTVLGHDSCFSQLNRKNAAFPMAFKWVAAASERGALTTICNLIVPAQLPMQFAWLV
jgi:hypothetical protein